MEQRQEIDEHVQGYRNEQIFIDKGSHEQINGHNWEQTSGTTMDEQQEQTLHGIYANKVEQIVKQKEIVEQVMISRQDSLNKHEDILEKNLTISVHLQNENEKINMKRNAEIQFSNKEFQKILKLQNAIEILENKFNQLNTLIQCCVRDQHQCDAANEKLQTEFNNLKIADEVKNQNYYRITQHFSKLTRSLQEEHIEKLKKYYSVLNEKEIEMQNTQENIIKLHYQEKDVIKTNNSLTNVKKNISTEKDTLLQNFTLMKEEYEKYVKDVDHARNKALDEIKELERNSKENTEMIETILSENINLEATMNNQSKYVNEMTAKNDELENSIKISNETCSMLKNKLETIKLQLQEKMEQCEEQLKLITQEIKQYEEKNSLLQVENASLEQNTLNVEQVIEELKADSEKHNNELIELQSNLKESQITLQDLISCSEEKINGLQNTIQEQENKKIEELKQIESLQNKLQSINDEFEKSEQEYEKLAKNTLENEEEINIRIAAIKFEVEKMQQSVTQEKENEREKLKKKLDEKLALKEKECKNNISKYEEHINRYQKESEHLIMNETTKKAKELNNLSNILRNMDLQIIENETATQNLEEAVKQKVAVVEQLREKLEQMKKPVKNIDENESFEKLFKQDELFPSQNNKENKIPNYDFHKIGYSSISISSISSQEDLPISKRIVNTTKRPSTKRSIQMLQTSTPKKPNPTKKLKSEEIFNSLFDNSAAKENNPKQKTGPRKSLF